MRRKPVMDQQRFETRRLTTNLAPAGQQALEDIRRMLIKRWRLESKPSLSVMLEAVLIRWSVEMQNDPTAIKELADEIKVRVARSVTRGTTKGSFKEDASSPEKLEQLADAVAKGEAISDAEDILKEGAL
jgi:hypothetical protein